MSTASPSTDRWVVSARVPGEVLTAEAIVGGLEIRLLGLPQGFSQAEIEGWIGSLAAAALEGAGAAVPEDPLPPPLRQALSGPVGTSTLARSGYIVVTNPPPQLALNPISLSFGSVIIGQSRTQSVQVINTGGLNLTGSVTANAPFAIQSGSPYTVPPGQTGLVSVSFSPTATPVTLAPNETSVPLVADEVRVV